MLYKESSPGITGLPIKIARNYYTTRVGGFGPLVFKDCATGLVYPGIGINEHCLLEKGIMPYAKCLVRPVDNSPKPARPAIFDYAVAIIPLSKSNYPQEFNMSPNGEAVLHSWFTKDGMKTLNFEADIGSQIILSLEMFERFDFLNY